MAAFLREAGRRAWLTGGTVRDLLLGRDPCDIDVITEGSPEALARGFADRIQGSYFMLSERFQTCRVVSADRLLTYDFTACRGAGVEDDLCWRDFTVDAMAVALPGGGELIDPAGGQDDLAAGRLRPVRETIFEDDPLRLLRALRLERQLGFTLDADAEAHLRRHAPLADAPSPERIYSELVMLLAAPGTAAAVRRLDRAGLLAVLLPEIDRLKGVTQNDYHHLDVFEHTLAAVGVIDRLLADPAGFFPGRAAALRERRSLAFGGDAGYGFILGFAELLHDVAKPDCAFIDTDGQKRFFEHDRKGAETAARILRRLRAGSQTIAAVKQLVRAHMRFEGLLQLDPPTERARLRYLRATAPFSPESIMMSVADRLSVRGRLVSEADVEHHLSLARDMMEQTFAAAEAVPLPRLVTGDDLMREFGLEPGPRLGRLLDHIEEEQQLGRLSSREEALAAAARLLQEEGEEPPEPGGRTRQDKAGDEAKE